jgi:hypothetical protein
MEPVKLAEAIVARLREMAVRHEQEKNAALQIVADTLGIKGQFSVDLKEGILTAAAKKE